MRTSQFTRHWLSLLALVALIVGCSPRPDPAIQFVASLNAAYQSGAATGQPLRIDQIAAFEWDQMFVFPARSSLKFVAESLRQSPPYDIFQARVFDRDDITLIVFLKGETIAAWTALERAKLDFVVPEGTGALSADQAVFLPVAGERSLTLVGG